MPLAAVYERPGNPADVVKIIDIRAPRPADTEVLIQVTAFPIHPGDLQGIERGAETDHPVRVGIEATGVVVDVGAQVRGFTAGQRVTAYPAPGAWSELVSVDARFVVPVPDSVPDEVATQMLVNPITVAMLRHEAEKHYTTGYDGVALNNAAGGAVGRLLTAGCDFHHLATISIVRSEEGAARLRERFPAVPVVSTTNPDWADAVRDGADGRLITTAWDPIGGQLGADLLGLLAPGGTLVTYGQIAPEPLPIHASTLLARDLSIRGLTIHRWSTANSPERRTSDQRTALLIAQALADHFDVAGIYRLDELSAAIDHVNRPGKVGAVLVRP
ncbi:alcohol dehydrogenase catalytic domain-containing protein [Mycobacteroides franklinii]|jgi:NADPH:quinone reductase-like Zn-dependent oxidoreductase|uniref:alcohol dehydrogenase catalytic domain-containing protein n=1 Tax=Mycobacteroides franklinii TaxID=948102 RepID=UPI0013E8A9CE|nr:dehydrogenase [Mycobacteroides franklinii]